MRNGPKRHPVQSRIAGLSMLIAIIGMSTKAAVTTVYVENFDFDPTNVTISVGDSVAWVWTSGCHSTTSSSGLWDSGQQCSPYSFTNFFSCAGVFPYTSIGEGFQGTVTVSVNSQVLNVCITNPASGSIFAAPWNGTLQATAGGGGGLVTNVQFFSNSTLAASFSGPPYNLALNNLDAGSYAFYAVAADNTGASNTSPVVAVSVVAPTAIVMSAPRRLSPTQFRFTYTADPGLRYIVQRASALPNFSAISTATAAAGSIAFTDTVAGVGPYFYRVGRLPNP
jgi:plastocyanin